MVWRSRKERDALEKGYDLGDLVNALEGHIESVWRLLNEARKSRAALAAEILADGGSLNRYLSQRQHPLLWKWEMENQRAINLRSELMTDLDMRARGKGRDTWWWNHKCDRWRRWAEQRERDRKSA